ncbi:MAG: hypothetical protein ACJ754_25085 [Pyrinomonadaceae bacterium]
MTYGTTRSGLRGAAAALAFAFALAPFAARAQGPAGDFERGKRLIAEGIGLLNAYVSETARADKQYPLPADSNEETRKPVFEKREAAVETARGIRFKPASIDGRPVSQFVVLEYNFN